MTEGYVLALIVVLALIYGKLSGVREQLKRIADFCERSEARMSRGGRHDGQAG